MLQTRKFNKVKQFKSLSRQILQVLYNALPLIALYQCVKCKQNPCHSFSELFSSLENSLKGNKLKNWAKFETSNSLKPFLLEPQICGLNIDRGPHNNALYMYSVLGREDLHSFKQVCAGQRSKFKQTRTTRQCLTVNTKYLSFRLCGFRQEDFKVFSFHSHGNQSSARKLIF